MFFKQDMGQENAQGGKDKAGTAPTVEHVSIRFVSNAL